MDLPLFQCGEGKDNAVGSELGDGRIRFEIINPGLRESPHDHQCFESDNVSVRVMLGFENPLAKILTGW